MIKENDLYNKYLVNRHWDNHKDSDIDILKLYLEQINFQGLIVEIGCGNGHFVNSLHESGFNAMGIDVSSDEVKNAKKKYPTISCEIQDAEFLKFENNSIDAFFMINVIHYVDKSKAIQEVFRTLKPDGFLFIHFNIEIIDNDGIIDYRHDRNDIFKLLNKFQIKHMKEFERIDLEPVRHTHKILELIIEKR